MMSHHQGKKGSYMGNEEIQILCYGDNSELFAENEDDLQPLLYCKEI